jgi:hypothetical protein
VRAQHIHGMLLFFSTKNNIHMHGVTLVFIYLPIYLLAVHGHNIGVGCLAVCRI